MLRKKEWPQLQHTCLPTSTHTRVCWQCKHAELGVILEGWSSEVDDDLITSQLHFRTCQVAVCENTVIINYLCAHKYKKLQLQPPPVQVLFKQPNKTSGTCVVLSFLAWHPGFAMRWTWTWTVEFLLLQQPAWFCSAHKFHIPIFKCVFETEEKDDYNSDFRIAVTKFIFFLRIYVCRKHVWSGCESANVQCTTLKLKMFHEDVPAADKGQNKVRKWSPGHFKLT